MAQELNEPTTLNIQKGTILYRGELDNETLDGLESGWFALSSEDAKSYGDVYRFQVTQDFKLVDLSNKAAIDDMRGCYDIYASKTGANANSFNSAFPRGDGVKVYRDTEWEPDTMVVNMVKWARSVSGVCGDYFKKFRGFGNTVGLPHAEMNTVHHPELFIFTPSEVLQKENQAYLPLNDMDKRLMRVKRQEALDRNQRKRRSIDVKPIGFNLDSDDDDDDMFKSKRRLF